MRAHKGVPRYLLLALIACVSLLLAAGPALAGSDNGKGRSESGREASENGRENAPGQEKKKDDSAEDASGKTSDDSSSSSSSDGHPDNSANSPSPSGSEKGRPAKGCDQADAGYDHNYASTCDGSPSQNGNGDGKATGKPCAGCVGSADNKNPKGQRPDGSDHNAGYECDRNNGIGKTNPAHTGCESTTSTPPPPPSCPEGTVMNPSGKCVPPPGGDCPPGTVMNPSGQCVPPPGEDCPPGTVMINGVCVLSEVLTCPEGTTMVDGVCVPPVTSCPEGTTMVNGTCVSVDDLECPEDTTMAGGFCVPDEVLGGSTCPGGEEMVEGVCVKTDGADGTEGCPDGEEMVAGACVERDEVLGGSVEGDEQPTAATRQPRVLGAVLPFTGASILAFLLGALGLIGAGFAALRIRRI